MKRWVLSFERNVETDNELRTGVRQARSQGGALGGRAPPLKVECPPLNMGKKKKKRKKKERKKKKGRKGV